MTIPPSGDRYAETTSESADDRDDGPLLEAVAPTLAPTIRVAGFWGAIVLPLCYVPVLATGLSSALDLGAFLGLLVLNLVALYAGHAHRR